MSKMVLHTPFSTVTDVTVACHAAAWLVIDVLTAALHMPQGMPMLPLSAIFTAIATGWLLVRIGRS